MNSSVKFLFPVIVMAACALGGCSAARSSVPFSARDRHLSLVALSASAKDGILTGPESNAWFSFDPGKTGLRSRDKAKKAARERLAIEAVVRCESESPVKISLGLVYDDDLTLRKTLVDKPQARVLAVADSVTGEVRIRFAIPDTGAAASVHGFAVSLSGPDAARARVLSASLESADTGWQRLSDSFWVGFDSAGGVIDLPSVISARKTSSLPRVILSPGSVMTAYLAPTATGTLERQGRVAFSSGSHVFGFRKSAVPATPAIPAFLVTDRPVSVSVTDGAEALSGLRVSADLATPPDIPADPLASIAADPHMIIEWPQASWRRADRELFSWDRFPSIIIFDTENYAVQDRYFKRLAFYVEKDGYRGRLVGDTELEPLHGYNAHDYRAESLAAFFDAASRERFALNDSERELEGILVAHGVILKKGAGFVAGSGAVLSFSRESAGYLRYLFMAHEGYHGIYFVDPDYRAKVHEVYASMDKRAILFLKSYWTWFASLGYDIDDQYLVENEFMAYLMQQPLDRVADYFTANIADRYVKHGGKASVADYVISTNAAEFVRAATELNDYVFARWGIAGGRVGLYYSDF
jgi:hypothetical protein